MLQLWQRFIISITDYSPHFNIALHIYDIEIPIKLTASFFQASHLPQNVF